MYFLRDNYTRNTGNKNIPGLYIEMKEPQWYMDNYGLDFSKELFNILEKFGLGTIQGATDNGIPIII